MTSGKISRRDLLKGSSSAAALASLPILALGQTTTKIRLEWQQFKTTSHYSSFLYALRTMQVNTNSSSRSSWSYWVNAHYKYCPHGIPYFLAWHRGYLYYFEQQLRTISGDSSLTVPYWDYYTYPSLPSEFIDPATNNPLYVPRVNTNVYNALSLAPFASSVFNFQRGTTNAFEPWIEYAPHNPVHNIIGSYMADMHSPIDPIFWLHHSNIDRLWHAWALPDGKGMPPDADPYWSGSFTYASDLTFARVKTSYPPSLGYDYYNDKTPTTLPPQAQAARIIRVQAQLEPLLSRPAVGAFATAPGRPIATNRRSLGGVKGVALDENSVSTRMPVSASVPQSLQDILAAAKSTTGTQTPAGPYNSIKIVLDGVEVTDAGKYGGYFYNVYLNLPESGNATSSPQKYLLGAVGAFEISGAAHHGLAYLEFPATEVLANIQATDIRDLTVSLVRVSGQNTPKGQTIRIRELRVDVVAE